MLKKDITYVDYNGITRTETFYFNLTPIEVAELEVSETGGFYNLVQKLISEQDQGALLKAFKSLILKAYGIKSLDGKYIEKSEAISTKFSQSEAYVTLFMELGSSSEAVEAFVKGIMPPNVQKVPPASS